MSPRCLVDAEDVAANTAISAISEFSNHVFFYLPDDDIWPLGLITHPRTNPSLRSVLSALVSLASHYTARYLA